MSNITIGEALKLHMALKDAKVGKLDKEKTMLYLGLKADLTDVKEASDKKIKTINEEAMALFNIKEGDKLDEFTGREYYAAYNNAAEKYTEEDSKIDSHILTEDDLYNSILSLEKNDDLTTESKALISKFLKKS